MRSLKPTQISRSWCRRTLLSQNGVLELPSEREKKISADAVQAPLRQVLTMAAVAKMSPSYIVERRRNPFLHRNPFLLLSVELCARSSRCLRIGPPCFGDYQLNIREPKLGHGEHSKTQAWSWRTSFSL
uniref:Uncharacterized protein n=1 Tax=Nelumbo nucifera TaxID=4432 RepID=A0A822ZFJ7_NELNU|nr:TPA_asm: hypothetical protein HUJ06_000751 [Nelumbo nucifera]